jgi:L-aspartate oxidase
MPRTMRAAELAPRDIVARAIDFEMKKHGLDHVWLDATPPRRGLPEVHFPTIHARCLALGIDIARQPIPVVPAAHYTCGGVVTDLDGRSDLPGLYAVGETTYTGLHGANRLASNSLLECVVLGRTCAGPSSAASAAPEQPRLPAWDESQVENADEQVVIAHNWDELRLLMWNYVGIVRTTKRLERALHRIELLRAEIDDYYANFRVTRDLLELRNLVDCAELIVRSALLRHESRGLHYSRDFPATLPVSFPTVLIPAARSRRALNAARPARISWTARASPAGPDEVEGEGHGLDVACSIAGVPFRSGRRLKSTRGGCSAAAAGSAPRRPRRHSRSLAWRCPGSRAPNP